MTALALDTPAQINVIRDTGTWYVTLIHGPYRRVFSGGSLVNLMVTVGEELVMRNRKAQS